jgi:hypothetical protein
MLKHVTASCGLLAALAGCGVPQDAPEDAVEQSGAAIRGTGGLEPARNSAGIAETVHTTGAIDRTNPFFQTLGTNARTCETCHSPSMGWTLTARGAAKLFESTDGLAPLFMLHDAGSRPDADISTLDARLMTFESTLLEKGLIRFTRTVPATAEFTVTEVVDPYGFATPTRITNFRRPTATANEAKVLMVTNAPAPQPDVNLALKNLVRGAAQLHEQRDPATPVSDADQQAGATMQFGIFFAQSIDNEAGRLDDDGATGGPFNLVNQPFYVGINDISGNDPVTHTFTNKIFNLFDAWQKYDGARQCVWDFRAAKRASIWRGQEIFNNKQFDISGVNGLNDALGQPVIHGTCGTCHNSPNVGGHSVYRLFDIGTADEPNCSPDLPLLTVQHKTQPFTKKICDMSRGGSTGLWADLGKFRAPPLRGLAARAPYFHDGQAKTVKDAIQYHDARFNIGLTHHEMKDLAAFLNAL